jgi:hypothetical protein
VRRRVRSSIAGLAAATLLLAAVPAGAATTPHAATADAGAVSVSLAGESLLEIARTSVSLASDRASAAGVPLAIGGEALGAREAISAGPKVEEGGCEITLPAPIAAWIDADAVCGTVEAHADGGRAAARAGVAGTRLVVADLTDELEPLVASLDHLGLEVALQDALDGALFELDAELLGPIGETLVAIDADLRATFDGLLTSCADAFDLGLAGPLLDDLLALLGELESADPGEVGALLDDVVDLLGGGLPEVCTTLLGLEAAILGFDGSLEGLFGEIGLEGALETLTDLGGLLEVSLLETESTVSAAGGSIEARAGAVAPVALALEVELTALLEDVLLPLLDEADAVLDELAQEIDTLLAALDGLGLSLDVSTSTDLPALPTADGFLALLLGDDIVDALAGPLLSVEITSAAAEVRFDGDAQAFAAEADPVLVRLGGGLFVLLGLEGIDDDLTALVGTVDAELLSASPLSDVLDVRLLFESIDEDADVLGLPGVAATSGAASVALLGAIGEDAVLQVDVSTASAAVGVGELVVPGDGDDDGDAGDGDDGGDDDDGGDGGGDGGVTPVTPAGSGTLPVTGGGAALLGLAALGAASALRRRD